MFVKINKHMTTAIWNLQTKERERNRVIIWNREREITEKHNSITPQHTTTTTIITTTTSQCHPHLLTTTSHANTINITTNLESIINVSNTEPQEPYTLMTSFTTPRKSVKELPCVCQLAFCSLLIFLYHVYF